MSILSLDKIDPRAHKFFTRSTFGTDRKFYWASSHQDLVPTEMADIDGTPYCIYCAEKGRPIQAGLHGFHQKDYDVTGRCCICDKALDEVDIKDQLESLRRRQAAELGEIHERLPVANLQKLAEIKSQTLLKRVKLGWISTVKDLEEF